MGLSKEKILLLRKFVNYHCEACKKNEKKCGTLEPHRINQRLGYILTNIKMSCNNCHKIFSSAQRIASGKQSDR